MSRTRRIFEPVAVGTAWLATATAMLSLRSEQGAVLLIWLPSAIAVASLHACARREWPKLLAAVGAAQLVNCWMLGLSAAATCAFIVAALAEMLITASLGIRALRGQPNGPRRLRHFAMLFGAAVAGASVSAIISLPFRADPSLPEFLWWFLASVLGVLTGVPVLLSLRKRMGIHAAGGDPPRVADARDLARFTAALLAVGAVVFSIEDLPLNGVLVGGIVLITIRNGQLGAACGVLAYAAAATICSRGGYSPMAYMAMDPFSQGLFLQALMLLMLAISLPLAAMLMQRDALERSLRSSNVRLRDNLAILQLAEQVAGLGRWQLDLLTGRQVWSRRMLQMNGLNADLAPDPGDVRDLLPDGGMELYAQVAQNEDRHEPYDFDLRIRPGGEERTLRMSIVNEFDARGIRSALFGVAIDVTEHIRREQALEEARRHAEELAAQAQRLAHTDVLTGLPNRRHALMELDRMIAQAGRDSSALTAIMFDIDHFKRINDTYGHNVGDNVLRRVAGLAAHQARASDLIGRLGGEEFVWLLPRCDPGRARALAERLRNAIESGSGADGLPGVTTSVGLAGWRAGDDADDLLARADKALYQAKSSGRNQVRRAA